MTRDAVAVAVRRGGQPRCGDSNNEVDTAQGASQRTLSWEERFFTANAIERRSMAEDKDQNPPPFEDESANPLAVTSPPSAAELSAGLAGLRDGTVSELELAQALEQMMQGHASAASKKNDVPHVMARLGSAPTNWQCESSTATASTVLLTNRHFSQTLCCMGMIVR